MRTNVAFQQKSGLHHFLLAFSSAKKNNNKKNLKLKNKYNFRLKKEL